MFTYREYSISYHKLSIDELMMIETKKILQINCKIQCVFGHM